MLTTDHRGPWISRLLNRGSCSGRVALADSNMKLQGDDLTVSTDSSELLEDFPSRRIRSCDYVQCATNSGLLQDFPSSPREPSQKRQYYMDALVERKCCQKRRVRFVEEKSTVHYYYKPNTAKYQQTLYLSKLDREQCRNETLLSARRINSFLRRHEDRTKDLSSSEAIAATEPLRRNNRSSQDKVEEIISCMLPDPSRFPPTFQAEEIIGIDHLISSKKVIFVLMQLRKSHTEAVLQQYQKGDSNDENLAQVSQKLSSISLTIARSRADYVAKLK
ncbi:hypothetical protein ACHAXS_002599 [Conticribra weissflogii]